jgi:hypothetical protein
MDRRAFVNRIATSTFVVSLSGYIPAALAGVFVTRGALRSLPAFLDTLLPDDGAPSATQLEVDRQLIRHAGGIANYPRLLQLGCQWLDEKASSRGTASFAQLGPGAQEEIVAAAELAPENSVQKLFFERVKSDSFTFYYSNPASWSAIGFSGPPQPVGFPDFAAPPKVRS